MKLKLVKATEEYREIIIDMLEEWYNTGDKIVPYAIRKADYHDFPGYLKSLETKDPAPGQVADSTFFCLDEERNVMVGAVNIRHSLNASLLLNGGHIGDGVRPSERKKGIATAMIGLALEECRKLGIDQVLMVCDKNNIGSAKSIQNNGGVLENEVLVGNITEQRYWIDLNPVSCTRYFRIHTKENAWITGQPRGIFTAAWKLVESKTVTEEEEKEYYQNKEYFEKVLPVPPFYDQGNPDHAVTWFKDTEKGKIIYELMTFYRQITAKYGVQLYRTETNEIPGEIIYEDDYQIAVKNKKKDLQVTITEV